MGNSRNTTGLSTSQTENDRSSQISTPKPRPGKSKDCGNCSVVLSTLSPIYTTVRLLNREKAEEEAMNRKSKKGKSAEVTEELKRPIYLGDLIIGYESVSPTKARKSGSTNPRDVKRKVETTVDLTPIFIPQDSVFVYGDDGKKRRVDLQKVAEMERRNQATPKRKKSRVAKKKLEEIVIQAHPQEDYVAPKEQRFEVPEKSESPTPLSEILEVDISVEVDVTPEAASFEDEDEVAPREEIGFDELRDKTGEDERTGWKTDLKRTETAEVVVNIPVSKDNPFLKCDDNAVGEDLSKCETASKISTEVCPTEEEGDKDTTLVPLPTPPPSEEDMSFVEVVEHDVTLVDLTVDLPTEKDIVVQEDVPFPMVPPPSKHFCNICGSGVRNRDECPSFLETKDNGFPCFMCLTCNQKFAVIELSKHKADCFLSADEFYYPGCEFEPTRPGNEEVTFRMVACERCVDLMKTLT